jgi:DNA mismatch endonuclease (patch repair protein)
VTDIVDSATRRRMMQGIRSRDTQPELLVRRGLHSRGFRYVLGGRGLPGRPDLVFPSRAVVVFVHGCFWHRHLGCRFAYAPSTRIDFWTSKFEANVRRDHRQQAQLRELGWKVLIVWECELRTDSEAVIEELRATILQSAKPDPAKLPIYRRNRPHQ